MGHMLINLRLSGLKRTGRAQMKDGKGGTFDCLVIPIAENNLYVSEKNEIFINLVGWESGKLKNNQTHLLKQSFDREVMEKMTDDQKKELPILGHISPKPEKREEATEQYEPESDDLPF